MKPSLVWNPVYEMLEARLRAGERLALLIVPYIKLDALRRLLGESRNLGKLQVIVRWRPEDLVSGASDVEVYDFLRSLNIPLYFNPSIHLKLYIFDSNSCFTTSANVTLKGLGYITACNVEAGALIPMQLQDWAHVYRLIEESTLVDEGIHSYFEAVIESAPKAAPLHSLPLELPARRMFTIASLPATESPTALENAYFSLEDISDPEEVRRVAHDLSTFGMDQRHANPQMFQAALGRAFRNTPFVIAFLNLLKERQSLSFGGVSAWIHSTCEDVPVPYRRDIKHTTRILYNWLVAFIPEVTWDVPGERSQVIRWQTTSRGNEN